MAAPLLALRLTDDPGLIAGLAFAQRLPSLLFPLLSGALADRLDRRRAMAAVAAGHALRIGGIGLAALLDVASLPLLYAVFFLLSAGESLFDTAAVTVVPTVVPAATLPRANARLAGTLTVTNQFAGPPLGGFLFAAAAARAEQEREGGLAPGALLGGTPVTRAGVTVPFSLGAVAGALLIPLVWSRFSEAATAGAD